MGMTTTEPVIKGRDTDREGGLGDLPKTLLASSNPDSLADSRATSPHLANRYIWSIPR